MSRRTRQRQGRDFPGPGDYLKNAEMTVEGNYNMVGDGLINNVARRDDLTDGQTWDELRNLAPETLPEEKQSVLDRLEQYREQAKAAAEQNELYPVDGHAPVDVLTPPERGLW